MGKDELEKQAWHIPHAFTIFIPDELQHTLFVVACCSSTQSTAISEIFAYDSGTCYLPTTLIFSKSRNLFAGMITNCAHY